MTGCFSINGVEFKPAEMSMDEDGRTVFVQPKVMALLIALVAQSNIIVSRVYLMDNIWENGGGSDESLTRLVYQLRRAFRSFPVLNNVIRTISTSGYKLEARVLKEGSRDIHQRRSTDRPPPSGREFNLSIAVATVTDHNIDPENQYLADGMSRDLTSLLAKTSMLFVTPYSSVTAIPERNVPAEAIAEILGCRFILSGSFHRQGEQITLRFELIDTVEKALRWSGKYNTVLNEFFEVQNEVMLKVSTAISTQVKFPVTVIAAASRPFKNDIYRIIQTTETLRYNYSKDSAHEIVGLLNEGLSIDPGNARLQSSLAVQLSQNIVSQWATDPKSAKNLAVHYIAEALATEPNDAEVVAAAGIVNAMLHRPDTAISYLQRAVKLDPNNAHALAVLGWQVCLRNSGRKGIAYIETAESRAPHHPRYGLWATYRATAYLFMLEYEAGVGACEQAIRRTPQYYQPRLSLAWALMGLKDKKAARQAVRAATEFEGPSIVPKYVAEMKKWSSNSPNAADCAQVLDRLPNLASKP